MTTNLASVAGPSRQQPKSERIFPSDSGANSPPDELRSTVSVSKPGLSVGENGEVIKVPAFLNKLFSMVSEPETDNLIYWADSGDSFFVPNHERLAEELLPRFFKHRNFSSFVRQLNMYGFHKVPHLQSGVLKNESPTELWEFVNPFFKRDQPQLLSRVMRKNNRPAVVPPTQGGSTGTRSSARQAAANAQIGTGYPGVHLLTDGTTEGEAGPLVGPTAQLADLHAIQTGINAIRQTQAAIGADLKALQASNEHLWREALESRERQQKHEETIDLIVSFLERLFGTEGEGLKGLKEAMRRGVGPNRNARAREDSTSEETAAAKRRRLMIEDGRPMGSSGSKNDDSPQPRLVEIQEPVVETASNSGRSSTEPWQSSGPRFTALSTDEDGVSPQTATPSRSTSVGKLDLGYDGEARANGGSVRGGSATPVNAGNVNMGHPNAMGHQQHTVAPYTSGHVLEGADPSGLNLDPNLLQTTIGSLLQSPAAAQMFLNSLSHSVQGQSLSTPAKVPPSPPVAGPNVNDPTLALFSPLPPELVNNTNNLLGAYQKATGVGGDVEKLQDSIDSLVRSMGLDLPSGSANGTCTNGADSGFHQDTSLPSEGTFDGGGFNVDELLDQLTNNNHHEGENM
ncbi:hypothetical protein CcaverHIS002_0504760 [Cutaneotrichosporon cavernicola]|uniref:HSF-type DNA-binding domain-containing protein n=1 Tax=Cutaneotrichosporon cavernicola TaxID=279322 RepID=A0AA48L6M2_9TREE|nr:uncharacterized protein CcaverHIS019_0505300 [Cutaneotrichosporon cavernicola]BEI85075.1 hypothetical protein CcaverHIS002_0504760 [Cutaneotrichosporon cavernicola]BEI92902.1 hypothetical protein CcaverHIS019_0505300 [Cutaneotrichosporon cavernicola]BEJ00678.1 hypothetical protein CcaverHIS631_0505350 [Cutaneotrichosporon cavernicola]BEJ08444.1 hypothetical protein CcaverHIS641_0505380 [Cutaneotrichosporon cavernicola]